MSDLVDVEAVIRRELAALKPPANRVTDDSRGRVVKHDEFTPYQLVAARGLLGWSQARLATEAGVNTRTVQRLETRAGNPQESTVSSVYLALANAGIEFFDDGRGDGIGVRRWRASSKKIASP